MPTTRSIPTALTAMRSSSSLSSGTVYGRLERSARTIATTARNTVPPIWTSPETVITIGAKNGAFCVAPTAMTCSNSHAPATAARTQFAAQFHGGGTTPARAIWTTATSAKTNLMNESTKPNASSQSGRRSPTRMRSITIGTTSDQVASAVSAAVPSGRRAVTPPEPRMPNAKTSRDAENRTGPM
jgi:hypothetical protein